MNALPIVIIKSNKDFCSSAFLLWKFLSIRNKNPKDLRFIVIPLFKQGQGPNNCFGDSTILRPITVRIRHGFHYNLYNILLLPFCAERDGWRPSQPPIPNPTLTNPPS